MGFLLYFCFLYMSMLGEHAIMLCVPPSVWGKREKGNKQRAKEEKEKEGQREKRLLSPSWRAVRGGGTRKRTKDVQAHKAMHENHHRATWFQDHLFMYCIFLCPLLIIVLFICLSPIYTHIYMQANSPFLVFFLLRGECHILYRAVWKFNRRILIVLLITCLL